MAARTIEGLIGGYAGGNGGKRVHADEYGWPSTLRFPDFLHMFRRHPLANAAVKKTTAKTWQTNPVLRITEDGEDLNAQELAVQSHLTRIRFWQQFAEADARSMVGAYGGLILRIADDATMSQPLGRAEGIMQVVEVLPAWEHQLRVQEFDTDPASEDYGKPKMWAYNEAVTADGLVQSGALRHFKIHPDRVIILSRDGTVHDRSQLEAGFNVLLDSEKITGAGAEGFFKTAKNAPVISMEDGSGFEQLAQGLGVDPSEVAEKLNAVVKDWSSGFDASLLLAKMKTEFPNITLPQPEEFWNICVMSFAASMQIPFKVLIGMITGERASTEDAEEWARTNESRRNNEIVPAIMAFTDRMQRAGVLPAGEWWVEWESLIEDGPNAKMDRAKTMSDINKSHGDEVFDATEIRVAAGHSPELPMMDAPAEPVEEI